MMKREKHPLASLKEAHKPARSGTFSPVPDEKVHHLVKRSASYEKMGVLILAGGQGTRLGFEGPKGCFELPLDPPKSLFQIHLEKIKKKGKNLSVAIMTSPLNHQATLNHFSRHNWFGLSPGQIDFFQQELIPACDDDGYLVFDKSGQLALAPDGNGRAFFHFYHSNIWKKWEEKNISYVQVMPVDNPLAEPFDGELLGCHESLEAELVLKCVERTDVEEKLGIIGLEKGRLAVCEYSEIYQEIKTGRTSQKKLLYPLAYTGLFSCSMGFIKQAAVVSLSMPWHLARKKSEQGWVWKFETFIFDLFRFAHSYQILMGERKTCFAPLKNLAGSDHPQAVAEAMSLRKIEE